MRRAGISAGAGFQLLVAPHVNSPRVRESPPLEVRKERIGALLVAVDGRRVHVPPEVVLAVRHLAPQNIIYDKMNEGQEQRIIRWSRTHDEAYGGWQQCLMMGCILAEFKEVCVCTPTKTNRAEQNGIE